MGDDNKIPRRTFIAAIAASLATGCANKNRVSNQLEVRDVSASPRAPLADHLNALLRQWGVSRVTWGDRSVIVPLRVMAHYIENVTGLSNLDRVNVQQIVQCINHTNASTVRAVVNNLANNVEVDSQTLAEGFMQAAKARLRRAGFEVTVTPIHAADIPVGHREQIARAIEQWRTTPEGINFDPSRYEGIEDATGAHILNGGRAWDYLIPGNSPQR